VRQIELNLERLRWLPHDFGSRYVLVNIPDYQLHAYDGGREVLTMRVIVGKQYENATPVFADTMSYVVFHPRWNVPTDIVKHEIVPKMQANVHWASEHGYEILDPKSDSTVIDPESIDWKGVDTATFNYRVRQKPGGENSLGRLKFMFPNSFDIYLHDTPAKTLFNRRERDFSHGCVRVEDPERLAQYVLGGDGEWTADKIRATLADTATVNATVRHKLPVYIVYLTAFSRNGTLQFRGDPYGADRRAMAKLGPLGPKGAEDASLCEALRKLMED
jgi:murein L,D-transpeptidase YcbB/YkuD